MPTPEREKLLLITFLSEYKKCIEERTGKPFNPRCLTIISQPNMKDANEFDWVSYNKWFDEVDVGVSYMENSNLFELFMEIPIHVLITSEKLGNPLLSNKDQKKLAKALKLISEIKVGKQG